MKYYLKTMDNKVNINYKNIAKNIEQLNKYNGKNLIAVVKNDAYNLGILNTTKQCIKSGVSVFAVANLSEAISIDNLGLGVDVIILNPLNEEEFIEANKRGFHILLHNIDSLNIYDEYLNHIKENKLDYNCVGIKFHLKINVGMNRFGIKDENIDQVIDLLKKSLINSRLVGLMTHFSKSDEDDLRDHKEQVDKFKRIHGKLINEFEFEYIHSENSATFLLKDSKLDFCNYARVGILLYGYRPIASNIKLYPTMELKNKIVSINGLKKGENLGYGMYEVNKDMRVGICPVGYGDGVINDRKNYPVYIKGKLYNLIGNISMSHMYIEIDDNISLGDEVEIYGANVKFDDILGVTNSKMMCTLKRKKDDN